MKPDPNAVRPTPGKPVRTTDQTIETATRKLAAIAYALAERYGFCNCRTEYDAGRLCWVCLIHGVMKR